ncbi:MAG: hypothetical protein KDD40_01575 [Bdellovibrionales bacterium]|nr:hypothetical protein [Bdellovibrionales bacterium]
MKNLVKFCITLLVCTTAGAGSKDSGGDPKVQQYLDFAYQLSVFFKENPLNFDLTFSADEFSEQVKKMQNSIADENIEDMIQFTNEILKDSSGIEKPAIFNSESQIITVTDSKWMQFSLEEKMFNVAMEV